MENPFAKFTAGARRPVVKEKPSDDMTDTTPKRGERTIEIDLDMKEIMVKFEFSPRDEKGARTIAMSHAAILFEINKAFDDDVIIFDNKNRKIKSFDVKEWTAPMYHQKRFVTQLSKTRRPKYSIIHRIHTSQSLSTIRNYSTVFRLLKTYNCYMKKSEWEEGIHDTIQAGYLIGINPEHYTPEVAARKVLEKMDAKDKKKMPRFKLVYSSPRIVVDGNEIRTKAYAIEFERAKAGDAMRVLKDTFTGTTGLLLAKVRYEYPQAFANALKLQTKSLASTYVIPIVNLGADAMHYLEEPLKGIRGVRDVVPTRNTPIDGRFNLLVSKEEFAQISKFLHNNFQSLYEEHVAEDAQPHQEAFYGPPGIGSSGDDVSSGVESFASMSAASFVSLDLSDVPDQFEVVTPVSSTYSWAEIVHGFPSSTDSVEPPSAAPTEQMSDMSSSQPSKIVELEGKLKRFQDDQDRDKEAIRKLTEAFTVQTNLLNQLLAQLSANTTHNVETHLRGPSNPIPALANQPGNHDVDKVMNKRPIQVEDSNYEVLADAPDSPLAAAEKLQNKRVDSKSTPSKSDFRRGE